MRLKEWNVDLDQIEIDPSWNFSKDKEDLIHRIHAYPAKFPAFITTKAIAYARDQNVEVRSIGDIFCGCGTVAYEAKKANIDFWGCDINPVATLIAKVKSSSYKIDRLEWSINKILQSYDRQVAQKIIIDLEEINDRIKYWFTDRAIVELTYLKSAINEVITTTGKYKNFFLVAFSNILKAASRWLTKSIKPTIDKHKKEINIRDAYVKQVRMMIKAFTQSKAGQDGIKPLIQTKNVLRTRARRDKLDLLITSPPYVTSYEYADLHQLSTLWLDYVNDFRDLRKGTIGSVFENDRFESDIKKLNSTGDSIVWQLYTKDKARSRSAARYYVDMQRIVKIAYNKLSDHGMAVFVIGNTEYKGVRINNAGHLLESMCSQGFSKPKVLKRKISNKILTPYRDQQGKFTNSSDGRKVYAEEYIVIGQKKRA